MSKFKDLLKKTLNEAEIDHAMSAEQRLAKMKYILQTKRLDKIVSPLYYVLPKDENGKFHGNLNDYPKFIDPTKLPKEITERANIILHKWYDVAQNIITEENVSNKLHKKKPLKWDMPSIVWITEVETFEDPSIANANGWVVFDEPDKIFINPISICINGLDRLNDTIPHEMAHLLDYLINGESSARTRYHGRNWQTICSRMGFPASRYSRDVNDLPDVLK